ncbi:host cell division inhibitor Icd-like protein [Caviibacterium pharyngocola]|uniref:host cell division inhibitor Icd-like protein n=1 Tax=Caviibacterium pharyngocola TaxID=28159 RepID=UPI001FAE7D17|nr:host cell division inhibitor Icd-like protein [Caviibacterium pharyngocola]
MKLFIFVAIRRTDLTNKTHKIRIIAESEMQARAQLARQFILFWAGEINLKTFPKNTALLPAVENNRLQGVADDCSIESTTTVNGLRSRQTSAFFMSQIPFNGHLAYSQAEFVTRSIRRNKAEFIRTNKASRLTAVVEALSHLTQDGKSIFTNTVKRNSQMKTNQNTALMPVRSTLSVQPSAPAQGAFMCNLNKLPVLSNSICRAIIASTTAKSGTRTRKTCGFLLSKIHSLNVPVKSGALLYIEFAARLRDRNKALSTNKIRRLFAVVDTLSHPTTGDTLNTVTKRDPKMKTNQNTALMPVRSTLSVQPSAGVRYA